MHICPGAKLQGKIELNANPYKPGLYAPIGAYVQQDDILCEILTIKELLTFSAKIRTSLAPDQIEEKVEKVI